MGWKEDTNTNILRGHISIWDENCGICEQISFLYPKIFIQLLESCYGEKGLISH